MIEVSFMCSNGETQETAMVREESVLAAMYQFHCLYQEEQICDVNDENIITVLEFLNGTIDYGDIEDKKTFIDILEYYNVFSSHKEFAKFLFESDYGETMKAIIKDIVDELGPDNQPFGPSVYRKLFIDNDAEIDKTYITNQNGIDNIVFYSDKYPQSIQMNKASMMIDDSYYIFHIPNTMAIMESYVEGAIEVKLPVDTPYEQCNTDTYYLYISDYIEDVPMESSSSQVSVPLVEHLNYPREIICDSIMYIPVNESIRYELSDSSNPSVEDILTLRMFIEPSRLYARLLAPYIPRELL